MENKVEIINPSQDHQITFHQPSMNLDTVRYFQAGLAGAPNTVRAYKADLDCYTCWCDRLGLSPFPASPSQVADYISELAVRYKVATIQRRLAMLSKFHDLQGMESPTGHKIVRTTFDGIKREKGLRQKMAPAFQLASFKQVIKSLEESQPTSFRDKIVLLLGFTGAFRRSELVSLNIEDLAFDDDGLLVELKRSKTDQYGDGMVKAIFYSADKHTCPVRASQRWIRFTGRSTGPLLVRVRKNGKMTEERLSDASVRHIVRQYLGENYSAHSLRASFVTVARRNGASTTEIMRQTGHKTETMVRRYTRFEDAREHNASVKLGL